MTTAILPTAAIHTLSMEEYLQTSFRPDCDFVDGILEERNSGEYDHVWLIDPVERAAFVYTGDGLRLVAETRILIENSPIYLDLTELSRRSIRIARRSYTRRA